MRAYADSSFILRLVTGESGTEEAVAGYRRLNRPALFYLPLHALEVENAILQRAFHERRVRPSNERPQIKRQRDSALSRVSLMLRQRALLEVALDLELGIHRARQLSKTYGEKIGARAADVLHVACALILESEVFLSFDARQVHIAKAEGFNTPDLSAG